MSFDAPVHGCYDATRCCGCIFNTSVIIRVLRYGFLFNGSFGVNVLYFDHFTLGKWGIATENAITNWEND